MSAEYTLRRPKAKVTFHTVEAGPSGSLYGYEPGYGSRPKELRPDYALIDVSTSKALHNAAGVFRLVILPVIPGEQGGGVGRRAREAQMAWYDRLRPMDLVSIAIGRDEEVMLGLVDQVTREEAIIGTRPRAVVTVTGRDFGKVWLVNRIKYIPAVASDPNDPDNMLKNTVFGFRPQILAQGMSVKNVVNVIMEQCRGLDLRLTNGKSVWDYIDYTTKVSIPEHFQLTAVNEAPIFSGSMYNYIKSLTDSPFMEVWIENYKEKAYLVLRETPFTREKWENLDTWEGSFSEDTRHERRHTISDSEIIRESLSRGDSEAFSIFQVIFANMPMTEEHLYNVIAPYIDWRLLGEYGLNHLEVKMQTLSFLDEADENAKAQVLERAAQYRTWLYEWYRHNPEFESGTIVIRGRPSIHVGDRIYHETLGKEFYVEQVSHSWSVGRPFTTTLGVTRGATDNLRWSKVERSQSWAYRREGSLV